MGIFYSVLGFAQHQQGQGWYHDLNQLAVEKHSQRQCEVKG